MAAQSREALPDYSDDLLQLRSRLRLVAVVEKDTNRIRRFEGNPEHPGSRGRNCAKGPATLNQVTDPERIRYPLKRVGKRGEGKWERVSWDEVLDDIAERVRQALKEDRRNEIMYHVGRPGHELLYHQRIFHAWGIDGHNSHTNVCSAGARAGYAFWSGIDRPSPARQRRLRPLLVLTRTDDFVFSSLRGSDH